MAINCGHCHKPHNTVAEVRECSQKDQRQLQVDAAVKFFGLEDTTELHPTQHRTITEGMWYLGNVIVKVQKAKANGSGHLYTKRLAAQRPQPEDNGVTQWSFEYFEGGMKRLRTGENVRKMTKEEAMEFGKLYGICCRCGRDLTDETSIALGIGPKCRGDALWM